eukprot:5863695-Pleurochrysis_carterae.AAC.2
MTRKPFGPHRAGRWLSHAAWYAANADEDSTMCASHDGPHSPSSPAAQWGCSVATRQRPLAR